MITLEEIRSKSLNDLITLGKEMRLEMAGLILRKNVGVREAGNKIPRVRKTIARIETIISEKKRSADR